jgi:uncharacterized protein (DUF58 family)
VELPARLLRRVYATWRRIRAWRRIKFTSGGLVFTGGAFAVGFAAVNTGNNLLYLLLGAMLGLIALSGWLSEQTLRGLEISRRVPRGVTVGKLVRITYHVTNRKKRLPTLAAFLTEVGLSEGAFLPSALAGESVSVRSENSFVKRGVFPLGALTLSTSVPFGMFTKERDVRLPGELVIWPRTDAPARIPSAPGGRNRPTTSASVAGTAGARGEYRGLREYRPGDDPRDIHWRSTARRGEPVVREYDADAGEALWICLDTNGLPGDRAESAIETAASLAAHALSQGRRFALQTPARSVEPGSGTGQLERVLDALARTDFDPVGRSVTPPTDPRQCLLVTLEPSRGSTFGATVEPGPWRSPVRRGETGVESQGSWG